MSLYNLAASKIEAEEGRVHEMYDCPAGYKTMGIGFNLEALKMPDEVIDLWLSILVEEIDERLSKLWFYKPLDDKRKMVLIDMHYQFGYDGLMKFKRMWKAIERKDFSAAADEMLDSLYAIQTPNRAARNAEIMRRGQ
ncbi:MAG: glycoside hydrolase family protein [Rickettsiales bacterium]